MIFWDETGTRSLGDLSRVDHESDLTLHKWVFTPDPGANEEEVALAYRCWEKAGIQFDEWEVKMDPDRAQEIHDAVVDILSREDEVN